MEDLHEDRADLAEDEHLSINSKSFCLFCLFALFVIVEDFFETLPEVELVCLRGRNEHVCWSLLFAPLLDSELLRLEDVR